MSLAQSIPVRISRLSICSELLAGPIVQTIFVLRFGIIVLVELFKSGVWRRPRFCNLMIVSFKPGNAYNHKAEGESVKL